MKIKLNICMLFSAIILSSCGGNGGGSSNPTTSNITTQEPVTVVEDVVLDDPPTTLPVNISVQNFSAYVSQAPQEWQDIVGPINNDRATLGRILFYDTRLSSNNEVSCATCHSQNFAFSDSRQNNTTSQGVNGRTGKNAPQLTNVALHPGGRMFWDERAQHLMDQADKPIIDTNEMNETFPALLVELSNTTFYEQLFINAFSNTPGNNISRQRLQDAIAEFEKTLLSFNAPFDNETLNEREQNGMNIFNQNNKQCSNCHGRAEPGATFNMVVDVGVPAGGGIGILAQRIDIGLNQDDANTTEFKVTSLRNVAVTAPFTHVGQMQNLNDLMDFYASAPGSEPINRPTTDPRVLNIGLDQNDRNDIIAFLETLTDNQFLTTSLFSDPFIDNL